jgi:hypothetical protein
MKYKFACDWHFRKENGEFWGKYMGGAAYEMYFMKEQIDADYDLWPIIEECDAVGDLPDGDYHVYLEGFLVPRWENHPESGPEFDGWDVGDVMAYIQDLRKVPNVLP